MTKTYVIYHGNCLDGFCSATIAYKFFQEHHPNTKVEYIAGYHQSPVPKMGKNSVIYLLDFSYPRNIILELQNDHQKVIILDHHKTAQEALMGLSGAFFNLNKSGAVLTWNYFFPESPLPWSVKMFDDRDLWKWEIEQTKPFTEAVLNLVDFDLDTWQNLLNDDRYVSNLVEQGKTIVRAGKNQVKNQLKNVYWANLPEQPDRVPMINSPHMVSETCQAMYDKFPQAPYVVMWSCIDDTIVINLRSRKNGGADVSQVAKHYGGGGHKNAAGAKINVKQWFEYFSSLTH